MNWEPLIDAAWTARANAYAPYSRFPVGSALMSEDGRIFTGCNVENLSFGLTQCAERVAIGSAISAGVKRISAVVVVADTRTPVSPCGACRQVMVEFGVSEVLLVNRSERVRFRMDELLPRASEGILDPADG